MAERRHLVVCTLLIIYVVFWAVMAINVYDRHAWWLENMLVFVYVPLLIFSYRHLPLSMLSYVMLFIFFCLHAVGSHFTYSKVPYDPIVEHWFGTTLSEFAGWQRNHYDRLVHFAFGALLAYPCRELFVRIANVRGFWGYFLPLLLLMSLSLVYELIEWWAAETFGGDLGMHYLGTQGDVWDGHRDMALASAGALLAMTITGLVNRVLQRDFGFEWADSLRVKKPEPLGERTLRRLRRQRPSDDDPILNDPRL